MKKSKSSRKVTTPALETTSLRKGQEFTSKIWAKHTSRITESDSYSSVITRIPLGRSHFNHIACSSAMHVATEPNNRMATLFLPLSGSMIIKAGGGSFHAAGGMPMFLPNRTAMEFEATSIECLLLELPSTSLLAELRNIGALDLSLEPMDWSEGVEAASLVRLLEFLKSELMEAVAAPTPHHLLRMESLLISTVAQALSSRFSFALSEPTLGRLRVEELRTWIADHLTTELTLAGIAAKTGISPRSLQKGFLRHFHTTLTTYLSEQRLMAIRKELSSGHATGTICEIALRYQFNHLGRFSQAYRKHFGELPSLTLSRAGRKKK